MQAVRDRAPTERNPSASDARALERILEAVPELGWIAGPDGTSTTFNRAFHHYAGEFALEARYDLIHPEDRPEFDRTRRDCLEGGEPWSRELRLRGKEGQYRWFHFRCVPLRDDEERIVRWFGTAVDIHDRYLAQTALRESEGQLRRAADHLPQIVVSAGPQGEPDYFNRRWYEYTGQTPGDPPNPWSSALHPDEADAEAAQWEDCLISLRPYERELRLKRADGEYRWFIARAVPVRDEAGEVVRWYGTCTDVHQAKARERALHFLSTLSEVTRPERDPERIMAFIAERLGRYLGATRCAYADVDDDSDGFRIQHDWTDGAPSSVGEYRLELFGSEAVRQMRGGDTLVIHDVAELAPQDGRDMFLAIGIHAIVCCPLVKEGRLVAMMAVHQAEPRRWTDDEVLLVEQVVERSWSSIEQARTLRDLESRVRARTRELSQAVEELESFTYSVAHDLRTPLRSIVGRINMVREDHEPEVSPSVGEHLGQIERAALNLGRLVDDLLEHARLGRRPVYRVRVDLSDLAARVAEHLPPEWLARGEVQVEPDLEAMGDANLLALVLGNLLENALKYSHPERWNLVRVGRDGKSFFVKDLGVGFESQFAEKIFLPFERLSPRGEEPGSGIGLANVRRVIERHGGRVWAESVPGAGSTFRFTLDPGTKPASSGK